MDSKKPGQGQIPQSQQVTIVHAAPHDTVAPSADFLQHIERRNNAMTRILEYAVSATHAGQWVDQNGKPWPTGPACEVMARRCAVSWKDVQITKKASEDDKGSFYIYELKATFFLQGGADSIEAIGTCSSRDTFLGTETREGRALSEIDEGNVMKAAFTNMEVNGITRLLGVRMLTWEKLAELGVNRSDVGAKVEHQKGSRGGGEKAEWTARYGRETGKKLSEVQDLGFYVNGIIRDIENPEKAKWLEKNKKDLATLKAEMARRQGEKRAPSESAAKVVSVGPYDKAKALCVAAGVKEPNKFIKGVTGKDHSSKVNEDDVTKVADAIDVLRLEQKGEAL